MIADIGSCARKSLPLRLAKLETLIKLLPSVMEADGSTRVDEDIAGVPNSPVAELLRDTMDGTPEQVCCPSHH